jgi:decaprenylphospho-beta-D-ribofuranose 2-oxidase
VSATHEPLAGIESSLETIESYSGLDSATVQVFRPASEAELCMVFEHARTSRPRRRVTLRAGGRSFDAQSLNDDLVISMERFDSIGVDPSGTRVTVGAGARWGDIVAALQPLGLVPAVTVTTSHATAGGTLAGDCLSRFSTAWGKEGAWIESFEFLTVGGTTLHCAPPAEDVEPARWTLSERVFFAAIGGLGYLGAFLSITYRVLDAGQTAGRIGVRTTVRKYDSFEALAGRLVPVVDQMRTEASDPRDATKHDAIYSALGPRHGGQEALLLTSSFTDSPERRRTALFQPDRWYRVPVEWLVRVKRINRALWWLSFATRLGYREDEEYVDDLWGFTFFQDGNVRAKRVARTWTGRRLKTIQQTFVVPADRERLVAWLHQAQRFLADRGLHPTLADVLYLPRDLPFALSATVDTAGFAVSYAFETSRRRELERVSEAFGELADVLLRDYGGRVYLVKNVRASQGTLAAMYGKHAEAFFALKAELDPDGVLRNAFLERTFGPTLASTSARPARGDGPPPSAGG